MIRKLVIFIGVFAIVAVAVCTGVWYNQEQAAQDANASPAATTAAASDPAATQAQAQTQAETAPVVTAPPPLETFTNVPDAAGLDVAPMLQHPELATGCESVAATILLNYYGLNLAKTDFADTMPKENMTEYNGRSYGPSLDEAFCGDPYSNGGLGIYAPGVLKVMNTLIAASGKNLTPVDVSGSSEEQLEGYISTGRPVMVWATMGMLPPGAMIQWYIKRGDVYTDEIQTFIKMEHALVLTGYDETNFYFSDPLKGLDSYSKDLFMSRYEAFGMQAIVID